MTSYSFLPSAEDLKLLSQVGEMLASHSNELAAGLQDVLEANAVFHEHFFSLEELSQTSHTCVEGLVEALTRGEMYCMPETVREQGAQFAQKGLGDRSLVDSVSAWQELCLPLVMRIHSLQQREQALTITAKALGRYAALFTEGFLAASRDRILDAQDEMIVALEKSLYESEQWLAITLKSIGDGVITTDTKGVITFMNPVAESLTGWTQKEAVGNLLSDVFSTINEETRVRCENPFEKILETGGIVGLANNTVLVARDGTERLIADSGAPIRDDDSILGTVLVFRDVTEKRRMEDDILRLKTEKMESISVLAGGIAHDFNNILTAILGNITIAKMHINREDKSFKLLTEAEKASLRAKDLTQQLLTFSKGGAPVKKFVSISELLKDTAEFALSGSKTSYRLCVPDDLWPVEIDAGQISQVINNLIINADQAMPGGGIITVDAENVAVGQKEQPLQQGTFVKISITDEGIGIPQEHLQRIFDPYFTTKQKGSGLGLAICDSIVRTHDGHITVESRLGVGTTFCIYLPVSHTEPVTRRKGVERIIKGKGCILLMDDEECILEATSEVLHYLGYTVVTARDGKEALDIYMKALKSCQPFDVVIMDLTIPGGMGGKETLQHLLEIDPDVKAIVSSGYSDNPVTAHYREYGFSGAVTKPYTVRELSETLHIILKNEERTQ